MSFFASFFRNNYRAIFGAFVFLVMLYVLGLVFMSGATSPDDDFARRLRVIFSSRLSG